MSSTTTTHAKWSSRLAQSCSPQRDVPTRAAAAAARYLTCSAGCEALQAVAAFRVLDVGDALVARGQPTEDGGCGGNGMMRGDPTFYQRTEKLPEYNTTKRIRAL
ncbi:hypothetical protein C8J57DRAFT_1517378 [Mycena rebaudengoi]|nr:hypothetical protein C8J57DRAFT_1517378 [Mycena rebaudengoi]